MTEIEKMAAGLRYDSSDLEIKKLHLSGKKMMWKFNRTSPNNVQQTDILRQMLGSIGSNSRINQPFWIDYGCNIYLGKCCFINMNCTFLDAGKIIIGDRTIIAPDVKIYTATHPIDSADRYFENGALITQVKDVVIGNDTWIGGGSIILPGVVIGNNVTIGAGSVVTQNIPDNSVAYGNPCRVQRSQNQEKQS